MARDKPARPYPARLRRNNPRARSRTGHWPTGCPRPWPRVTASRGLARLPRCPACGAWDFGSGCYCHNRSKRPTSKTSRPLHFDAHPAGALVCNLPRKTSTCRSAPRLGPNGSRCEPPVSRGSEFVASLFGRHQPHRATRSCMVAKVLGVPNAMSQRAINAGTSGPFVGSGSERVVTARAERACDGLSQDAQVLDELDF
jgi:hypothetical protein